MYNMVKLLRQKMLIDEKKVSQRKLAEITGIPRSTLGEIELHKQPISPKNEVILVKVFNLSNKEFLYK